MAGTRLQICVDVLHGVDAVMYGICKYKMLAEEKCRRRVQKSAGGRETVDGDERSQTLLYGKHYACFLDLEDVAVELRKQKLLYFNVLSDILREQSITAIDGEKLAGTEDTIRGALKSNFGLFVGTAELIGKQIHKLAEALRVRDRFRIELLPLVFAGDPRDGLEKPEPQLARQFGLSKSEERFRSALEAELEVPY